MCCSLLYSQHPEESLEHCRMSVNICSASLGEWKYVTKQLKYVGKTLKHTCKKILTAVFIHILLYVMKEYFKKWLHLLLINSHLRNEKAEAHCFTRAVLGQDAF